MKRHLVPLQVTSQPLQDKSWCVGTRSAFGEVFPVPQLTMSNDGVSDRYIKSQIVASETKFYVLNPTPDGFPPSGLKTLDIYGGADAIVVGSS